MTSWGICETGGHGHIFDHSYCERNDSGLYERVIHSACDLIGRKKNRMLGELGVGVLGDVIPPVLFTTYYLRLKPDQEQS